MSIANKLSYLNQTKKLIRESINNIGGNLTPSNTFRSYAAELQNIYNRLPKVSNEGTSFILSPTLGNDKLNIIGKGNTFQTGEPTPSNPQPIKVVTGDNKVIVRTANLTNINLNETSQNFVYIDRIIQVKQGHTYYVALAGDNIFGNIKGTNMYFRYQDANNDNLYGWKNGVDFDKGKYIVAEYDTYIGIRVAGFSNYTKLVVSENIITDYVPYKRQELPLNLGSIELCKIGNYQDEFILENDTWYKDKKINNQILNVDTTNLAGEAGEGYTGVYGSNIVNGRLGGSPIICDKLQFIQQQTNVKQNAIMTNPGTIIIIVLDNNLLSEPSLTGVKAYMSANPFKGYYILATPVREEITNSTLISQLNAIYNALSYSDKTYIETESEEENAQLIVSANCLRGIGSIEE